MLLILMRHAKKARPPAPAFSDAPLLVTDDRTAQWREEHPDRLQDALLPIDPAASQSLLSNNRWVSQCISGASLICTSKYTHAWQTGTMVATAWGDHHIQTLWTLTPCGPPAGDVDLTFNDVLAEMREIAIDPEAFTRLLIVSHMPRLTQLLKSLTARECWTWTVGAAVHVSGSLSQCRSGQAAVV